MRTEIYTHYVRVIGNTSVNETWATPLTELSVYPIYQQVVEFLKSEGFEIHKMKRVEEFDQGHGRYFYARKGEIIITLFIPLHTFSMYFGHQSDFDFETEYFTTHAKDVMDDPYAQELFLKVEKLLPNVNTFI